MTSKDSDATKIEKLNAFIPEGDIKPIALMPITGNSTILRLTDDMIMKRLAPIYLLKSQGGTGFFEKLSALKVMALPDFFTWLCVEAEILPEPIKIFVRNLADATREGFFSTERFLKLLPFPDHQRKKYLEKISLQTSIYSRHNTVLGHGFRPIKTQSKNRVDWSSQAVNFSSEEASTHMSARAVGIQQSPLQDLDLADSLLKDTGNNFMLGLRFILRYLADKNPVAVQEKAVKLGLAVWARMHDQPSDDINLTALLSSLRQNLANFNNVSLALFPLRSVSMESEGFNETCQMILSLGDPVLPPLMNVLGTEQDRAMRKKLCHLITLIAQTRGVDFLLETAAKSPPFLLRNIVMILGDVKNPGSVEVIVGLLGHAQKIVRVEAVRSLCKIGTKEVHRALISVLQQGDDVDAKKVALEYFVLNKQVEMIDPLIAIAKENPQPALWRRALYSAIAGLGGYKAKQFLESIQGGGSIFSSFSAEQREDLNLVKSLLARM